MPFKVGTLDEIHEELLADFANRFPGADVSRYSDNWKRTRNVALAGLQLNAHIDVVQNDLLPDGAAGAQLDRLGAIYNVTRKPATPAKKSNALRLVGTVGAAFTLGDELVHDDTTRYQVNESGVIPGAGFVDVDVLALDVGSSTRKNAGQVLRFLSAPGGIESNAELQLDMDEDGDDEENDGTYRARILDKIAQPGMGGNRHDYETWALEVTGISAAFIFPTRNGLGSVDIAALHTYTGEPSSASPHPRNLTADERDELADHIDERRPVSVADLRILATAEQAQDVEVLVIPEDGTEHAFDWGDQVPLVVLSWTAGTRTLLFTTNRPDDLVVGKRIVYKSTVAPFGTGREYVVEALSGASGVVLTEAPTNPPVAGNLVYSGGPLVAKIRTAGLAHMHLLGPARGSYAAGAWEGTLRTSTLFKIAQLTVGVLDSEIPTPAANVTPANDDVSPTVGFIVPRQFIVRRKH